jgi:hypothetical protein
MQPSPIAETSRAPVRSCLLHVCPFPAAEEVRWLVSLPEDETVLTVVRGVVVSVELVRPGRRRFWRHRAFTHPALWSWLASGDKDQARPRVDGSSPGWR